MHKRQLNCLEEFILILLAVIIIGELAGPFGYGDARRHNKGIGRETDALIVTMTNGRLLSLESGQRIIIALFAASTL